MVDVDPESFLVIVTVAALAALIAGLVPRSIVVPVVVIEILLGILVGPDVLHIAHSDQFTEFFADLGLGMLFFFAGYEIEFRVLRGPPLRLAGAGWLLSLVLAYAIAAIFVAAGPHDGLIFFGAAMATTAIGTLIPVLHDAGELRTRFGTFLLGAGAAGEFGPILMVTVLFSAKSALTSTILLIAFVGLAVIAAFVAVRSVGRGWNMIERSIEGSGQLGIRATVVIVFALVALATELGLDLLLGGFVAGVIVSLALRDREVQVLESKLVAIGYGFLIPFFFVYTGITFDISALWNDWVLALGVPAFALCFLIIRGIPAMTLYLRQLDRRSRVALAIFSATELPLVVAITTIAVRRGEMGSGTAASLVGAAVLSTALFPTIGLRMRRKAPKILIDEQPTV
jgi:Kef-type K+ transport system membrane component KefB